MLIFIILLIMIIITISLLTCNDNKTNKNNFKISNPPSKEIIEDLIICDILGLL